MNEAEGETLIYKKLPKWMNSILYAHSCTINIGRKHVNVFRQKKKTGEREIK